MKAASKGLSRCLVYAKSNYEIMLRFQIIYFTPTQIDTAGENMTSCVHNVTISHRKNCGVFDDKFLFLLWFDNNKICFRTIFHEFFWFLTTWNARVMAQNFLLDSYCASQSWKLQNVFGFGFHRFLFLERMNGSAFMNYLLVSLDSLISNFVGIHATSFISNRAFSTIKMTWKALSVWIS